MNKRRPLLPGLLLLLLLAGTASAAEVPLGSGFGVEADQFSFDQEAGVYRAAGNVQLSGEDLSFSADSIEWDAASGEAVARGQVQLRRGENWVRGEEVRLNLNTGLGRFQQAEAFLAQENFHFSGEEIERRGEKDFLVRHGRFTLCDMPRPDWSILASEVSVDNGRWAEAWHARLYIGPVPVFYLPYLVYPIRQERESGFLLPGFGYSDRKGTEISLTYYWVMARNLDLTLDLDVMTDLGLGTGGEFRYILGDRNPGEIHAYHLAGSDQEPNQLYLRWQHDGWLQEQLRLTADAEWVARDDYFLIFGDEAEEYNRELTVSSLALTRPWNRLYLVLQGEYTQDLAGPDDAVLQRLPRLDLSLIHTRLGQTPLFALADLESTYFWRQQGLRGERLTVSPGLAAIFNLGKLLAVEPRVGYLQRFYWTQDPDESYAEGVPEARLLANSRFSRVYQTDGERVRRVQHLLEPRLSYRYRAEFNEQELPQFDLDDSIDAINLIGLALTNRLTARLEQEGGEVSYHEFLLWRISQEYDVHEQRRELVAPEDDRRPWGPLRNELLVRPTRRMLLDLDVLADVNSGASSAWEHVSEVRVGASYSDDRMNLCRLGYVYQRDLAEYLSGELSLSLFAPVYLRVLERTSLAASRSLEHRFDLEFREKCWGVKLSFQERPDEKSIMLTLTMGGFGELTTLGQEL